MTTLRIIISIITFIITFAVAHAQSHGIYGLPPFERDVVCIKYFEGLHRVKDYPYVGYGHRIQPGERFRLPLTHKQADALLRKDLRKLCRIFRSYGKDSLILATLAYNVGYGTLMGNEKRPKSSLVQKIEQEERDILSLYIDFCKWNGKRIPSIRRRRWVEYKLLHVPWCTWN